MGTDLAARSSQATRLQKERQRQAQRQQVAAVCYRVRKSGIQFLLVKTRAGRWIFPKGGAEPGLTYAQSAALEAFEEAGVHGRIESLPFAHYSCGKPYNSTASADPGSIVIAHLCEVSRLETPQEQNRDPTWFSAENAKQKLLERRNPQFGSELCRVLDRAMLRIQRLHKTVSIPSPSGLKESLQEVRFEAGYFPDRIRRYPAIPTFIRDFNQLSANPKLLPPIGDELQRNLRTVLRINGTGQVRRPILRLGIGADTKPSPNITAIDSRPRANSSRSGNQPSNKRNVASKSDCSSKRDRINLQSGDF